MGLAPHLRILAIIVQQQHLVLRYGRDERFDPVVVPLVAVEVEQPRHLEPFGLGIGFGHRVVNRPGDPGEELRFPARRIDLVERIGTVNMVRAEECGLLGEELPLNPREERIERIEEMAAVTILETAPFAHARDFGLRVNFTQLRGDMPGEGRKHGFHVQLPLTGHDPLLQLHLRVEPALGAAATASSRDSTSGATAGGPDR